MGMNDHTYPSIRRENGVMGPDIAFVHRGSIVYLHSLSYISTITLKLHVNIPEWIWRGGRTLMTPYVQRYPLGDEQRRDKTVMASLGCDQQTKLPCSCVDLSHVV